MKWIHTLRVAAAAFLITAGTMLPVAQSEAFLGGIVGYMDFDVEVGLDRPTRDFLQNYPAEVRKQAVDGANQILDRADLTIARVFTQGKDFLMVGKDVITCAGRTGEHIPRGMLERAFGFRPNYTNIVEKEMSKLARKASITTRPAVLNKEYVDVDNIASDAICLTLQGDLDQHGVLQIRPAILTSALMWKRMEPFCKSVGECYAYVSATVEESMRVAVQQDKAKVKADERLAGIVRPPAADGKFDLFVYERALNGLLALNDDLIRVSTSRIAEGVKARDAFAAAMNDLEPKLTTAEQLFGRDKVAGCNQGYNSKAKVTELSGLSEQLKRFEILTPTELAVLESRRENLEARNQVLVSTPSTIRLKNDGRSCQWYREKIPGPYDGSCTSPSC